MTGYNMPPGCSPSDIPGNGPNDGAMEHFLDSVADDVGTRGLRPEEASCIWRMGLMAWDEALTLHKMMQEEKTAEEAEYQHATGRCASCDQEIPAEKGQL